MKWHDYLFLTERQRLAVRLAKRPDFYETREWLELRYKVLRHYGGYCRLCGIRGGQKDEGGKRAVIQVDHIKPRSKYPHLALSFKNLQPACKACNLGKSNKYHDNWI